MKLAYQKDNALLADIEAARVARRSRLWWLGQSGFLVCSNSRTVLFDPYLSDSLTNKYMGTDKPHTRITERVVVPGLLRGIDIVTSSHGHTDHLDAETLLPLLSANPESNLIVPTANRDLVLQRLGSVEHSLVLLDGGETVTVKGVRITGIAAAHNEVDTDAQGHKKYLGYVAELGPTTIYHSGDTLLHEGLAPALTRFALDVVLLPINGNKPERRVAGNMDGIQAAALAKEVGARLVIPHHFDMFEFNTASPDEFESECRRIGQPYRVLRNGEGLDL